MFTQIALGLALVIGTITSEGLVYPRVVSPSERAPTQTHMVQCLCPTDIPQKRFWLENVRITVIQEGDSITFVEGPCPERVQVYKQGITGWLHEGGFIEDYVGKVYEVEGPIFFKEMLTWVVPVTSLRHVAIATVDGGYELMVPGGIQLLTAWSPEFGEQVKGVTVFDGARVNFDWSER